MFDHVGVYVTDMAPYVPLLAALGVEPSFAGDRLIEWGDDLAMSPPDAEHEITRGLHIGLVAPDLAAIERFHRAGLEAGFTDDGPPGPRPEYGPDYVGGFLRDQDGNSIEACLHDNAGPPGVIDHLWLRVRDAARSRAFYEGVSEFSGFTPRVTDAGIEIFRGRSASFHLVEDPSAATEHVHIAFPAGDDALVHGFHAAALRSGGRDHGPPGERPQYHAGYYAAFALDPDGNNIEVVNHHR